MKKGRTTISDNPVNEAILIDPRSGKTIATGTTPTELVSSLQSQGRSLSKAPKAEPTKEEKIKAMEEELAKLKEN